MAGLHICLMGTIEVSRDGAAVELPGRRVRALLGHAGAVRRPVRQHRAPGRGTVGRRAAAAGCAAACRPTSAACARRSGPTAWSPRPSGYALRVDREEVDLLQFYDRVEAAARCVDPLEEREALAAALAAWRAEPFGEAPSMWLARYESPLWVERHLQAVERRVDLDLLAGDHARCVTELQESRGAEPAPRVDLAALATCSAGMRTHGRGAHALRDVAQPTGRGPAAPFRRPASRRCIASCSRPQPGRSRPLRRWWSLRCCRPRSAASPGAQHSLAELYTLTMSTPSPSVVAVHGPAGTGKTSLALHWAHGNRRAIPRRPVFRRPRGVRAGRAAWRRGSAGRAVGWAGRPASPACRRGRRNGPRSGDPSLPRGGRSWCWTTPATAPRCVLCCRAARAWCS